jgi:hypothetical protein
MDPRGWTYSEQYRHQCEVRYVLAMPTPERRRAYLDGVQAARGKAAADRLRADVRAAWAQSPRPSGQQVVLFAPLFTTPPNALETGDGSFLAQPNAGNSDPIEGVVSRGGGR